jgi:hypothetical protein
MRTDFYFRCVLSVKIRADPWRVLKCASRSNFKPATDYTDADGFLFQMCFIRENPCQSVAALKFAGGATISTMRARVGLILLMLLTSRVGCPVQARFSLGRGFSVQSDRQARYRTVLDNDFVAVFVLELPAHFHAASYQNARDVLWIGLNDATVTFLDSDRKETAVQFRPGDIRFFPSFATQSVVNQNSATFRGVLVALKARAASGSCGCGSSVEKAVCGCPDAAFLPRLWAVAVRNLTIAGTTLGPGQRFAKAVPRGNTLLVAVTKVNLEDETAAAAIQLEPGQARWLPAGAHRLKNLADRDARFVTVEF